MRRSRHRSQIVIDGRVLLAHEADDHIARQSMRWEAIRTALTSSPPQKRAPNTNTP